MNTVQAVNGAVLTNSHIASDIDKRSTDSNEQSKVLSDQYSATSANDAVVAKVINTQLNQSVGESVHGEILQFPADTLSERYKQEVGENDSYSVDTIVTNIVSFVGKTISSLATQGYDDKQLSYYIEQAQNGIELGISQAKSDLKDLIDEDLVEKIDLTKQAILDGMKSISTSPSAYLDDQSSHISQSITLVTKTGDEKLITFGDSPFYKRESQLNSAENYTSSVSSIDYSISQSNESNEALANLINKTDGLLDTFYRQDIEGALAQVEGKPYSENESSIGLADLTEMPSAVQDYLNKYLDLIDSSKSVLKDEKEFNKIINGMINEMKDVQVPDLLQAINRFHAFNNKFVNPEL